MASLFKPLSCFLACTRHSHPLSLFISLSLTHNLLQDMHIISTDEKQVFAAVQEWNQNNTYSLYISDSPGVYFTLSLENLRTSRGPAGNLLVDFYKVRTWSRSWAAAVTAPPIPLPDISHTRSSSCQEWRIFQSLRWRTEISVFVWPTRYLFWNKPAKNCKSSSAFLLGKCLKCSVFWIPKRLGAV